MGFLLAGLPNYDIPAQCLDYRLMSHYSAS